VFSQSAEPSGRLRAMHGNTFQAVIEDPNRLAVPANPDIVSQVFAGNRVIRMIDGDVAITRTLR